MKPITGEWLKAAYQDLFTIEHIVHEEHLTTVVSFHSEQAIEKCFKALLVENDKTVPKTHDIRRLHKLLEENIVLDDEALDVLLTINELYIESRYPGDIGLLPDGKPSLKDAKKFYDFSNSIFERVCSLLNISIEEMRGR